MNHKQLPFDSRQLEEIIREFPTPFHIYDEQGIRDTARKFNKAFQWVPKGFKNYYAVKACPNPWILKVLQEEGMGTDSSSLPELILSHAVGIQGELAFFTSNNTPLKEYRKAKEIRAKINLDDITHLDFLDEITLPDFLSFRYNPGPAKTGNILIGDPKEAKYGLTRDQLLDAYRIAQEKGVKHFGLHTMVASNCLDINYLTETAEMLFTLLQEINESTGVNIEIINLGGGIGIPYRPDENPVDIQELSEQVKRLYTQHILDKGINPPALSYECGRLITGPHGYLVTEAIHEKHIYKDYIGINSSMADLMRPALYGAYHHITVMGKEKNSETRNYDVVGSLCENNDKFAINRNLPIIERGDIIVIHDTGAHGRAMGFNYNGKLRSGELLLKTDGTVQEIRRREELEDYFSTLNFPGLNTGL